MSALVGGQQFSGFVTFGETNSQETVDRSMVNESDRNGNKKGSSEEIVGGLRFGQLAK